MTVATLPKPFRSPKGSGTMRVYAELRERILNLDLPPGSDIDEGTLERTLGVSRTPIREALIRLASEGLVVHEPNRGASVAPISLPSVRQFFEALNLVQRAVTRWAAIRRSPEQLRVICETRDAFEAAVAGGDTADMNEANSRFHTAIAVAGGNAYLVETHTRLFSESLRLARLTLVYASPDGRTPAAHLGRIQHEHRALADAIAAEDADGAEGLAAGHTRLFQSRVKDYLSVSRTDEIKIGPLSLETL